jgi:enoyl-CoA hydratase
MTSAPFEDLLIGAPEGGAALITINRPDARNALRSQTLAEIVEVLDAAARDSRLGAIVITGSERYFAAGADLKEMAALGPIDILLDMRAKYWKAIAAFPKALIAAVNGHALGGGCELAMHADIIIAGQQAAFGQPEINLGIMPGAGGTQRLARSVGKSRAMQMVLSGEPISAERALQCGLVSEVVPAAETVPRALALAKVIAAKAPLAVRAAKEAVLLAFESPLAQALEAERKAFALLAATKDRNEGIEAFLNKRPPRFQGR